MPRCRHFLGSRRNAVGDNFWNPSIHFSEQLIPHKGRGGAGIQNKNHGRAFRQPTDSYGSEGVQPSFGHMMTCEMSDDWLTSALVPHIQSVSFQSKQFKQTSDTSWMTVCLSVPGLPRRSVWT
ncbi:uncharacterized protein LOC144009924 isoform X1 [Festucalex cinctus]